MKKLLFILLFLLVIACSQQEDMITMGFIGPLSGDAVIFGLVEKNAIEIAVDEINADGGINGKKLNIIYEDGRCTAKDAVTAANKLINIDKVKILLVDCVAETLAVAPLAEENHIIEFTAYAMSAEISDAGDFVFRSGYSDADTARIAAETIYARHKKVGIIS